MTTAVDVAAYIKQRLGIPGFDTKKVQKLTYFSQAWALAWTGNGLFDDPFEAWPDGPVVRRVYQVQTYEQFPTTPALDDDAIAIIESVIAHYGSLNYVQLVDLTHDHEPWKEARRDLAPTAPSSRLLDSRTIRRFYTRQAAAGHAVPVAPVRKHVASAAAVDAAIERQGNRWRETLDALATR